MVGHDVAGDDEAGGEEVSDVEQLPDLMCQCLPEVLFHHVSKIGVKE